MSKCLVHIKIDPQSPPAEVKIPSVLTNPTSKLIIQEVFQKGNRIEQISDEAIIKICRQLEFWYTEGGVTAPEDIAALSEQLVDQSIWYNDKSIKVPTTRYGKKTFDS